MSQNRSKVTEVPSGAIRPATAAQQSAVPPQARKKASAEYILAAQLNQARETIVSLLNQIAEQEQNIAALQQRVALSELQTIQRENEKLREQHGLKVGVKLEKDQAGDWWIVEEAPPEDKN